MRRRPVLTLPTCWRRCRSAPAAGSPTTVPGARLPNVILGEGAALRGSAARRRLPLDAISLDDVVARRVYGEVPLLVRPDGHVARRGRDDPRPAEAVVARVPGWEGAA